MNHCLYLHNRVSVILTNNLEKIQNKVDKLKVGSKETPPIVVMNNIEELIESLPLMVEEYKCNSKEVVVIGGSSIYEQFLPYASKMIISLVKGEFYGDKFFPKINRKIWKKTNASELIKEENDEESYSIVTMMSAGLNIFKFPGGERLKKIELHKVFKNLSK